jgi:hypothetical protein
MNDEKNDPPVPLPVEDLLPVTLSYHQFSYTFYVDRKKVFTMRPESFIGVSMVIDEENQKLLQCPPFVAFQMRVSSDFQIEQMGDGFPCKNEARAKEIISIIEAKNVAVPIVLLASWGGHFGFITSVNFNASYEELVFHTYPEPQTIGGNLSKFSLKLFKRILGGPDELLKEIMLPTTDPKLADELVKEKTFEIMTLSADGQNQPGRVE